MDTLLPKKEAVGGTIPDVRGASEKPATPPSRPALGSMPEHARGLGGRLARARFLLWRRKEPAEVERLRRLDIHKRGRISAGHIVDLVESEVAGSKSSLVVYSYEVAGVAYEAAQDVSPLPEIAAIAKFLPGRTVSVKYDTKRPANSIVACEEWTGLPTGGWELMEEEEGEREVSKQ